MEDAFDMISKADAESNKLRLGVRRKSDNQLIGTLLLTQFRDELEIGFSFGKNFWGRGYGQETVYMVEQALRSNKDVSHLIAWCMNENIASLKIFEKAEFELVPQNKHPNSTLFKKATKR